MPDRQPIVVVGAGLTGAVTARQLAERGHPVQVLDRRDHVAGNCHTERDPETGVMVHVYGPHIFHTADREAWDYVTRFGRFRPYTHRVRTTIGGRVYGMPINLLTINQFFGRAMSPNEARAFVADRARPHHTDAPANFEEQALSMIGPELYEAFFKGYTEKAWGRRARDLPASIFRRLPLRFTYDDTYFAHPYQGIPEDGYTEIVRGMLDHPLIGIALGVAATPAEMRTEITSGAHVIWTGPLDAWFGQDEGPLGYRTLDFTRLDGSLGGLGCSVMNYGDAGVAWTRISDHGEFARWEAPSGHVLVREVPRECGPDDIPFYPIRLAGEKRLLSRYVARAGQEPGVTFAGRLGTYRYLDMDVSIREALDVAAALGERLARGDTPPAFVQAPA